MSPQILTYGARRLINEIALENRNISVGLFATFCTAKAHWQKVADELYKGVSSAFIY